MSRKGLLLLIGFFLVFIVHAYGQDIILGSKHLGTEVQEFGCPAGEFIDSFKVTTSGEYAILIACSGTATREVFRSKLLGIEVDEFIPSLPGHINMFTQGGPDGNGYVCLIANSSSGESDTILKTKLVGTGVNEYTTCPPGEYIDSLGTLGPDADGFVYLVIGSTELGIYEVTGFTATPKKNHVLLKWRTEEEKDSYKWYVQRREVDGEFKTVGTVDAQGNVSHQTEYEYEDHSVQFGQDYYYRLELLDINSSSSFFGPLFVELRISDYIPRRLFISQNFPNPFGRHTNINFGIPLDNARDITKLSVYDVTGRRIRTLIEGKLEPGYYTVSWNGLDENGKNAPSGVYFYRLDVGGKNFSKKMIYVK